VGEAEPGGASSSSRRRLPRVGDLFDVTDEMIAFADKYQQVWEHEAKATLALGEFLQSRAQSLRAQVELMRMGSESFRKYSDWSQAIFGVRPETFMQGFMDQMERWRPAPREQDE
jgi:hypothetical protein